MARRNKLHQAILAGGVHSSLFFFRLLKGFVDDKKHMKYCLAYPLKEEEVERACFTWWMSKKTVKLLSIWFPLLGD